MIENAVIYEDRLDSNQKYKGCSFRSDRLEIHDFCQFTNCNFNCSEVVIYSASPNFKNCLFIGEVYVHYWISEYKFSGMARLFHKCKIKSLVIGRIDGFGGLPYDDDFSLFGIQKLGSLRLDKERFILECDRLPYDYGSETKYFSSNYYRLVDLIYIHSQTISFDIYIGDMKYDRAESWTLKMGKGFMPRVGDTTEIMVFRDSFFEKEFVLLPNVTSPDKDECKIFVSREMVTNKDMAKIADYSLKQNQINGKNSIFMSLFPFLDPVLRNEMDDKMNLPCDIRHLPIDNKFLDSFNFKLFNLAQFNFCAWGNSSNTYWWGDEYEERRFYEVFNEPYLLPSGSKECNAFGLYDMYTNLAEVVTTNRRDNYDKNMLTWEAGHESIWARGINHNDTMSPELAVAQENRKEDIVAQPHGFRLIREL